MVMKQSDDVELKLFDDVSLNHDLDEDTIDDHDDFFDSVKSMFSDDRPSKKS